MFYNTFQFQKQKPKYKAFQEKKKIKSRML